MNNFSGWDFQLPDRSDDPIIQRTLPLSSTLMERKKYKDLRESILKMQVGEPSERERLMQSI